MNFFKKKEVLEAFKFGYIGLVLGVFLYGDYTEQWGIVFDRTDIPFISSTYAPHQIVYVDVDDILSIPYAGEPFIILNDHETFFSADEKAHLNTYLGFEEYAPFDSLGRTGTAYAYVTPDMQPTEDRESISHVYPTGWVQGEYDIVNGGWLYNRCHLIAFAIAGEQDNELNLITGTRDFNVSGMLPFEIQVMTLLDDGGDVVYRVTPIYDGTNLLCHGVLMEAYADEFEYCVYIYNVQDGIEIDYATGQNKVA